MSDKISLSEVCTRWRAPAEDIFSLVFKEYGFSFFYNGLEFSPEKWYNVKCIMINLLILINQFALLSDFLRRLKINSH